jgi:glycerol-3-phosphate dehydrogenase
VGAGRGARQGVGGVNRAAMLDRAVAGAWDLVVVGGGATCAGVAVDAATRGYSVLLLEGHDFGKGTSGRSTKLVHGGVRYLKRGDIKLVTEALRERQRLLRNAPHVVRALPFVIPSYRWWEVPFYAVGLKLYDTLAGRSGFDGSRSLTRREVIRRLPTIRTKGLRGGVLYSDGQFDDTRLLIHLVRTAADHGAAVVNYARVVRLSRDGAGRVVGVVFRDEEGGREHKIPAKVVVNATGVFCDGLRTMADPSARPMVTPSQGIHLVFDRSFLPGESALMVPATSDGRVLFAIPWHGHTLVGTTDVAIPRADPEPRATDAEIDFILDTAGRYLAKPPTRADVRSVFAGIRPLVRADGATNTATLSRDHAIRHESGLITVTGGKWTTYRNMAEDAVNVAAKAAGLPRRPCVTSALPIHGRCGDLPPDDPLRDYGTDAAAIRSMGQGERLHPDWPYTVAEIVWAVRYEMARTVEDVLARRVRVLMLDAAAAETMAPRVAALLAAELGRGPDWRAEQVRDFTTLARGYRITTSAI